MRDCEETNNNNKKTAKVWSKQDMGSYEFLVSGVLFHICRFCCQWKHNRGHHAPFSNVEDNTHSMAQTSSWWSLIIAPESCSLTDNFYHFRETSFRTPSISTGTHWLRSLYQIKILSMSILIKAQLHLPQSPVFQSFYCLLPCPRGIGHPVIQHVKAEKKWLLFCRRPFRNDFIEIKFSNFHSNLIEICSQWSNQQ